MTTIINGQPATPEQIKEERAFVAKMLREAADKVERAEYPELDWEDKLITRMVHDIETHRPKRVIDGYEVRVKMWKDPNS